jgi:hypothetical protein
MPVQLGLSMHGAHLFVSRLVPLNSSLNTGAPHPLWPVVVLPIHGVGVLPLAQPPLTVVTGVDGGVGAGAGTGLTGTGMVVTGAGVGVGAGTGVVGCDEPLL